MSYNEDYNKKIDVIKTITDDQIKTPHNVPVGIYIQESENLYHWCQDDKEELMAKGLDWKVMEDLPVRCGALSVAESNWQSKQSQRRASEKIWLKETSKGYDLRKVLVHHFHYAFRDNSSLIGKVKEIANKSRLDGMINGLYALSVLGLENQELLKKIGFDFTLLALAAQKSNDLNANKEMASFDSEDYLETKKIRDQAFTHLKEAVDYIREYAKYVFWRNPIRLKGYRSNHIRNSKRKRASKTANALPGTETGTEALKIKI
jgi:hypothetical protein